MAKSKINQDLVRRPEDAQDPSSASRIQEVDGVIIQVTQAFCPNGHNVVLPEKGTFDGEPGICLRVSDGKQSGEVVLSPFHGDHTRLGLTEFKDGTRVSLACPTCGVGLKRMSRCSCGDGRVHVLYLTKELKEGFVIALCDVWGCHRSKVFDQAQLLSAYVEEDELDDFEAATAGSAYSYH